MVVRPRTHVRALGFGVIAALLGALLVSAPAESAGSRVAIKVTLSAPASAVSGSLILATGTVKRVRLAAPAGGVTVVLQKRVTGSSSWSRAGSGRTNGDGRYSIDVSVAKNTDLRAVVASSRAYAAATSSARRVAVDQYVNVSDHGPSIVDAGDAVWLAGDTSVGLRGERVVLEQQGRGGAWRQVTSGKVRPDGSFRVSGSTPVGGFDIPFRVRAPSSARIRGVASDSTPFTVYAWYPLSSMKPLTSPAEDDRTVNFKVSSSNRVAGTSYPDSWASLYSAAGFDRFEHGRGAFAPQTECSMLEATLGVNDAAGSNAAWQFLYYQDGNEYNYGYVTRGRTLKLTRNVTAVNRFRLVNNRRVGSPDDASYSGNAVWAGARIKCAGQP